MKKTYLIVCLTLLFCCVCNVGSAKKEPDKTSEAEIAEIAKEKGDLVLKVWCYSKKPKIEDETYRMEAIKNVLFNGVVSSGRKRGMSPLLEDASASSSPFFKEFFEKKRYNQYAEICIGGYVNTGNLVKTGKYYRVAKIVKVNLKGLRKMLEDNSIINPLDYGF